MPVSIATRRDLVFVVNSGGTPNISGFRLAHDGTLSPIPGSSRPLGGSEPAEIAFDRGGDILVVTEKATNTIDTFLLDDNGVSGPFSQPSSGATPFGFTFDIRDHLLVTEAFGGAPNASAVSSYDVSEAGRLTVLSASVPTRQTSACWIVVTDNGRYAYTGNASGDTVSGFSVGHDGTLALLNPMGIAAQLPPGSDPLDLALSAGSRFLYSLNAGSGTIGAYRVAPDGSLGFLGTISGVPPGAAGLLAQ